MWASNSYAQTPTRICFNTNTASPQSCQPVDASNPFPVAATATITFPTFGAAFPATGLATGVNIGGNLLGTTGFTVGSQNVPGVAIVNASGAQITSFGGAATTSNATSGQATTTNNQANVAWNYVFNGTTWDQETSITVGSKHAPTIAIVDASGNQITTFGGAASTSNATSGVATSSSNQAAVTWLYGWNGTTWDQIEAGDVNNEASAIDAVNVTVMGPYNATPVTLTDTRYDMPQVDVNGHTFVTATNIILPTANFTRPANTTPYVSGQLLGNSTTAGSVVPMSLTVNSVSGRKVYIRRVVLKKSTTGVTAPNFRIHLYTASPTIASGDGAAYSTTQSGHFCDLDVNMYTVTAIFSDGNDGIGTPNNGAECAVAPTTTTVFALIEARGAYAPGNAEVFTVAQLETYEP